MKPIDCNTVMVCTPSHTGQFEAAHVEGLCLISGWRMYGMRSVLVGCTGPQLARDILANGFLVHGEYEWLVFIDADIGFTPQNFEWLLECENEDEIVTFSTYARKTEKQEEVHFGLGFAKIHRTVFLKLSALNNEDGSPTVQQFMHQGSLISDYFPSGCLGGKFYGEDTGFFTLCKMAGITPRIEERCYLKHTGRKDYILP